MELIVRPRAGGKTHAAVQWVQRHNGVLVVMNAQERQRILEQYVIRDDQVVTWFGVAMRSQGERRPMIVDNAEVILESMLGGYVEALTLTGSALVDNG